MKRVPEPELMDDPDQARAYAEEDFSEPNQLFLDSFRGLYPTDPGVANVIDLGCGPADITLHFARAYPFAQVAGLDGSSAMLALAESALTAEPCLEPRVRFIQDVLPSRNLAPASYDIVLSNSLLHHLNDPQVLWETIAQCSKPGAQVLIMDLVRPVSPAAVDALVETYAGNSPEVLRQDFRNSLYAAFSLEEIRRQLDQADLAQFQVAPVSDRHLIVSGRV